MVENCRCSTELMRVSEQDVVFGALALFHSFGQTCCLNNSVNAGACLTLLRHAPEVMRGFEEAFGRVILEGYGLSETSPVASFNHLERERKAGSIGTPIRGVR